MTLCNEERLTREWDNVYKHHDPFPTCMECIGLEPLYYVL